MRESARIAGLCCVGAILAVVAWYLTRERSETGTEQVQNPSLGQYTLRDALPNDAARQKCAAVASVLGLDLESRVASPAVAEGASAAVTELVTEQGQHIRIRTSDGQLLSYFNPSPIETESVPENLRKEDGVSKEQALGIARSAIDSVGIPWDNGHGAKLLLDENGIRYEDHYDKKPDDLLNAHWIVTARWSYKDLDVLGGVTVIISAYSGAITKFAMIPFEAPASIEQEISQEQAVDIARRFAEGHGFRFTAEPRARLLVLQPNNFWSRKPEERCVWEDRMRVCWWVSFKLEASPDLNVWVDAETREVVGGYV